MARAYDFLKRYSTTVNRMVDITNERLMASRDWLDPVASFQNYVDYRLLLLKIKKNNAIAHIVGFEAEIPESQGGKLTSADLQPLKVGKSHVMTERDMEVLRTWEQNVNGVPSQVKDYYFGTRTSLPPLVRDTHTMLYCKMMTKGKIDYVDEVSLTRTKVVYNDNTTLNFPPDLTAVPDPNYENAVHWTDQAGARPLQNIRQHYRLFRDVGKPNWTWMTEETYDVMVDTAEVRRLVAARNNVDASTANSFEVSVDDANAIFRTYNLPPLQIIESRYETEAPDGSTTEHPFIDQGNYVFAWNNSGERALGPVESNNGRAGIHTFSEELSKEPPKDRSVGVSTGCPMPYDTRKIAGRQVYAA